MFIYSIQSQLFTVIVVIIIITTCSNKPADLDSNIASFPPKLICCYEKLYPSLIICLHNRTCTTIVLIIYPNIHIWFLWIFTARGYAKRGICRRRVCVCVCVCVCLCVCHTSVLYQNRQEALLMQRDRARHLWVEILQLQNILLENPIVWHYLRDCTFSLCDTIPEWDRHTHRQTADTRRRHIQHLA